MARNGSGDKYNADADVSPSIFEQARRRIKERLASVQGGIRDAADLVARAMEAEGLGKLNGKQKSRLVREVLSSAEIKSLLPVPVIDQLTAVLDTGMLDPMMHIMCQIAKHRFDINTPRDALSKVADAFKRCCGGGCDSGCCADPESSSSSSPTSPSQGNKNSK
jgi:hypothetical protein